VPPQERTRIEREAAQGEVGSSRFAMSRLARWLANPKNQQTLITSGAAVIVALIAILPAVWDRFAGTPRPAVGSPTPAVLLQADLQSPLRTQHGLRLIEPEESGFLAEEAPRGVYGFVDPPPEPLLPPAKSEPRPMMMPRLYRAQLFGHRFEFHKRNNGSLHLVGFVGPDAATQLKLARRTRNVRFILYNEPWSKASEIVALPFSRLRFVDSRSIEFDRANRLRALDVDLDLPAE
jgi:hypothetical protein